MSNRTPIFSDEYSAHHGQSSLSVARRAKSFADTVQTIVLTCGPPIVRRDCMKRVKKVKPVKVTSKKAVTKKRTKQEEAPTRTEPGRRTRSTGPSAKSKERS